MHHNRGAPLHKSPPCPPRPHSTPVAHIQFTCDAISHQKVPTHARIAGVCRRIHLEGPARGNAVSSRVCQENIQRGGVFGSPENKGRGHSRERGRRVGAERCEICIGYTVGPFRSSCMVCICVEERICQNRRGPELKGGACSAAGRQEFGLVEKVERFIIVTRPGPLTRCWSSSVGRAQNWPGSSVLRRVGRRAPALRKGGSRPPPPGSSRWCSCHR